MKFIAPKNGVDFKEGENRPCHMVVDDILLNSVIGQIRNELQRPFEDVTDVTDVPEFHIDGGGMVHMHEPVAEILVRETKITCFARQLEFLLPCFLYIKDLPGGHKGVFFGGKWTSYMFNEDTAKEIHGKLQQKAIEMKDEIDQWWRKMDSERITKSDGRVVAVSLNREQMHEFLTEEDRCSLLHDEIRKEINP